MSIKFKFGWNRTEIKKYFTRRPVFMSASCRLPGKAQEIGQRQGGQRNIWQPNHNMAPQRCRVVRVKPRTHLIIMLHVEFLTCSCTDLPQTVNQIAWTGFKQQNSKIRRWECYVPLVCLGCIICNLCQRETYAMHQLECWILRVTGQVSSRNNDDWCKVFCTISGCCWNEPAEWTQFITHDVGANPFISWKPPYAFLRILFARCAFAHK